MKSGKGVKGGKSGKEPRHPSSLRYAATSKMTGLNDFEIAASLCSSQ
ncbi:MAG: hypothetical protein PHY02_04200 [Phycisphaerae bacterium]|nr:hypothetical protein [Phycisphaerae bacterium]